MKATKQYFPVVLFIMLYKVVLTFEPVDEILKCDHSNESYWAVLSCGAVYYAVQGGSMFESVDEILRCAKKNLVQQIQEVTFPHSDWWISIRNPLCFYLIMINSSMKQNFLLEFFVEVIIMLL